jgi:5-methylcytosine-specific restriction endonuclease McrA
MERKVSAAKKKQIAGKQRFCCAGISGYKCPLDKKPFDESGYEIDHILELCNGGSNEDSNLQALCLMCHRVKTSRMQMAPKISKPKKAKVVKIKEEKLNYYDAPLFTDRSKVNMLSMYDGLMDDSD